MDVAKHPPTLAKVFFVLSVIPVLVGLGILLLAAVKAHAVPLGAAVLLFLGIVPSEFAAPPGEWLLGIGALWAGWALLRSREARARIT